jgi:hypothetical protein
MDKKTIKWKLNLFDLLVMALVLIAAVGVVGMKYRQQQAAQSQQGQVNAPGAITVRYEVELTNLLHDVAMQVKTGDKLTERTRKESMGTVESVEVTQTRTQSKNELTGDYFFAEIPERYTATMMVTSPATKSESKIMLDSGLEVRAGQSVRVFGPGYYGTGYITYVERG